MNVFGRHLISVDVESSFNSDIESLRKASILCSNIELFKYVQTSNVDSDFLDTHYFASLNLT